MKVCAAALVCALLFADQSVALDFENVAGWGAYPLSPEVSSLWFTGPESPEKPPPFVVVYYLSKTGWHDLQWKFDVKINAAPGRAKLIAEGVELSIEAEPAKDLVAIQGREFSLALANVFLVTNFVGANASQDVSALGLFRLTGLPPGEPASVSFLRSNPEILVRLNFEVAKVNLHASQAPAANATFREIAAGPWGFEAEGARCQGNPHTVAFSSDGSEMTMRYSKSLDKNQPTQATYKVLAEGPDYLRMAMLGEDRKTDAGVLVQWDLILLSRDSYCWHRTDWSKGSCTQPASRCPLLSK